MEAPFLSASSGTKWDRYPPSGFSAGKMVRLPYIKELHEYIVAAEGQIRVIAIAPELEGAIEAIREMSQMGIVPSAAHTCASYAEIMVAIDAGLKSATHLYNGMRRQDHREPGVIEAVLTSDEISAEIIADFEHILPPAIEIALCCKNVEQLFLVTDNTKYAGLPDGIYSDDQGRQIVKEQFRAYLPGWSLAGSVSPYHKNLKNQIHGLKSIFT